MPANTACQVPDTCELRMRVNQRRLRGSKARFALCCQPDAARDGAAIVALQLAH
jgi:hypothetical protein